MPSPLALGARVAPSLGGDPEVRVCQEAMGILGWGVREGTGCGGPIGILGQPVTC